MGSSDPYMGVDWGSTDGTGEGATVTIITVEGGEELRLRVADFYESELERRRKEKRKRRERRELEEIWDEAMDPWDMADILDIRVEQKESLEELSRRLAAQKAPQLDVDKRRPQWRHFVWRPRDDWVA